MNLIISFSGRANGNCDDILAYISTENDTAVHFRNLNVHECSDCAYECFAGYCKYHHDDILGIERHRYGQKIDDKILDVDEVKNMLAEFVGR